MTISVQAIDAICLCMLTVVIMASKFSSLSESHSHYIQACTCGFESVMIGLIHTHNHCNSRDRIFTVVKSFYTRRLLIDAIPPRGVGSCNACLACAC